MKEVLLGRGREILAIPEETWKQQLQNVPQHGQARLSFMTDAHHRIRRFVVTAMAKTRQALEPAFISEQLRMPLDQVQSILQDLETHLFFLVRNEGGAVAWAYPVTVEITPHKVAFGSGEQLYGA